MSFTNYLKTKQPARNYIDYLNGTQGLNLQTSTSLENPYQNQLIQGQPNHAQNFLDNTQPVMDQINTTTGLVLSTSDDPLLKIQGQNMVQNSAPTQTDLPDVSDLTGENINYGQQFLNVGMQLGNQLASSLGGKAGQIASKAVGATGSIVNSAKNLKALSAASEAGVENLGTAKAGNVAAIAGAVADLAGAFLPEKTEYSGPKGDITKTMDSVYDGISDAAMSLGPVGMIVGGAMKGGAFLSKGMNALGGGTDSMTTTDAILGSSFLSLTPFGLINGFGGKKSDTITKDEEAFTTVGASYTGSNQTVDSALQKSGKKYGLFSSGARKQANREIAEAKRQQDIISRIADEATDRFNIMSSMASINENRRSLQLMGGYDQSSVRAAKYGMVIQAKRIVSQYNILKKKEKFQKGGTLNITLGEYKEGGSFNTKLLAIEPEDMIEEFKEGGTLEITSFITAIEPEELIQEYKEGGSFNVIPEGALHARLHHMENADNLTKKGIPVVIEKEGGELEKVLFLMKS